MLRRTAACLGRPKGPPGQVPGKEHRLVVPYRSEVTMLRLCGFKRFNSNVRELYKQPLMRNNLKAIPRDLGELPRNYVVKQLFFHQPVRLLELWEVLKAKDDVPIDSAKHLRLVLKIAKAQRWVYAEKNQSNNYYYYYIHRSRVHEVQDMIRQDEVARKSEEAKQEAEATRKKQQEEDRNRTMLDESIQLLQSLLVNNLAAIQSHDPQYCQERPYVTEDGVVDVTWHWEGAAEVAKQRAAAAERVGEDTLDGGSKT